METEQSQSFRLLDLPAEIRNRIYQTILCSFDVILSPLRYSHLRSGKRRDYKAAAHSLETTILRTCHQVHREAFDVMVKTNQFIKIQIEELVTAAWLIQLHVPVVTLDHAEQFQGYVMSVHMAAIPGKWIDEHLANAQELENVSPDTHSPPARPGPSFSFMILRGDWETCGAAIGSLDAKIHGFASNIKITATLCPPPTSLADFKAPIASFFSSKIQEDLLCPLRTKLRGFPHVEIRGSVSPDLAAAIAEEVKQTPYKNAQAALQKSQQVKDKANSLYASGRKHAGDEKWATAINQINHMRGSISWPGLVDQGGPDFVSRIAEIHFTLCLYIATHFDDSAQAITRNPSRPKSNIFLVRLTEQAIGLMRQAVEFLDLLAGDGSAWLPSSAQMVEVHYRCASASRLQAQLDCYREQEGDLLRFALMNIERALQLAPGDPVIEREKANVLAWEKRYEEAEENAGNE